MADEEDKDEFDEETAGPPTELPKRNYVGNSYKDRDQAKSKDERPEKKVSKVIEGTAVQRKKPLRRKIADTFTGDDMHTVGDYILFDVVLPSIRNLIFDVAVQGLERRLFGDSRGRRLSSGSPMSQTVMHTAYNRMSSPAGRAGEPDGYRSQERDISRKGRATHDFNEIVIPNKGDAEMVLDTLIDMVDTYGTASVYELYELVGITGNFADQKWGWNDLRASSVDRVRDGYFLNLPKPKPID